MPMVMFTTSFIWVPRPARQATTTQLGMSTACATHTHTGCSGQGRQGGRARQEAGRQGEVLLTDVPEEEFGLAHGVQVLADAGHEDSTHTAHGTRHTAHAQSQEQACAAAWRGEAERWRGAQGQGFCI